jgi:hypothetical protein
MDMAVTQDRSHATNENKPQHRKSWAEQHPHTPDGRYFVVRGRLWRLANPHLDSALRSELVTALMAARRALKNPGDSPGAIQAARARVDAAKRALGERGEPWWTDGAPDYNRKLAINTPYARWYAGENTSSDWPAR